MSVNDMPIARHSYNLRNRNSIKRPLALQIASICDQNQFKVSIDSEILTPVQDLEQVQEADVSPPHDLCEQSTNLMPVVPVSCTGVASDIYTVSEEMVISPTSVSPQSVSPTPETINPSQFRPAPDSTGRWPVVYVQTSDDPLLCDCITRQIVSCMQPIFRNLLYIGTDRAEFNKYIQLFPGCEMAEHVTPQLLEQLLESDASVRIMVIFSQSTAADWTSSPSLRRSSFFDKAGLCGIMSVVESHTLQALPLGVRKHLDVAVRQDGASAVENRRWSFEFGAQLTHRNLELAEADIWLQLDMAHVLILRKSTQQMWRAVIPVEEKKPEEKQLPDLPQEFVTSQPVHSSYRRVGGRLLISLSVLCTIVSCWLSVTYSPPVGATPLDPWLLTSFGHSS